MLIALCSAKGAPGVTTSGLALALSWPRPVVLAELDPAGGDVLPGYGRGEPFAGGLADLELAARRGGPALHLDRQLLRLDSEGRARLLPGLADPAGARHMDWNRLAAVLAAVEDGAVDVVADCGRRRAEHFPAAVVQRAAAVVLATGSTLRAVRAATQAIAELRGREAYPGMLGTLVIGPGSRTASERSARHSAFPRSVRCRGIRRRPQCSATARRRAGCSPSRRCYEPRGRSRPGWSNWPRLTNPG
ncbi:hypothetical protein ACFQX8_02510 [Klenkia terrae]|uniref:hypothetical protein n=1 Tax=Klenkia terrae TaxID=1052259 RepID=UPI00361A3EC0